MTNEELAVKIKSGDISYIPRLWDNLQRLLCKLVNGYYTLHSDACVSAGLELDDLVQESYFATLDAVGAWTPESGNKLASYLNYPLQNRLNALAGLRTQRGRRDPMKYCRRFEEPLGGEEDITLGDTIADNAAEQTLHDVIEREYNRALHDDLESALATLETDKAEAVTDEHYRGLTIKQAAEKHSVPPETIRQRRASGLSRLRTGEARRILRGYQDDIISHNAYRGGVSGFVQTWTSSTEWTAFKLMQLEHDFERIPDGVHTMEYLGY